MNSEFCCETFKSSKVSERAAQERECAMCCVVYDDGWHTIDEGGSMQASKESLYLYEHTYRSSSVSASIPCIRRMHSRIYTDMYV